MAMEHITRRMDWATDWEAASGASLATNTPDMALALVLEAVQAAAS